MLMDRTSWVNCDSPTDLKARLASLGGKVFEASIADESNTWGYIAAENNILIPIGFSDVGLPPQLYIHKNIAVVGVSDTLSGYSVDTGKLLFTYHMPTVFHEFVLFTDDGFVIQDEIGFVGLSYSGSEIWSQIFDDMIETYSLKGSSITGETVEGTQFSISIDFE
jgi:hypothetical protein